MKQYLTYAACILLVLQTGCTCNNNKNKNADTDSVETARSISAEDSALLFDRQAHLFISNTLQTTAWKWNQFSLEEFWAEDSVDKKTFTPEADFYKKYADVLKWSPDSTYILDIGSYGSVVLKDTNGNNHIMPGDPDTEVALLYPKEHKKWRLLFGGPSTHVLDAVWADSSDVAMLGALDTKETGHPDTLLWIIDVKENFFRKYKWH